MKAPCKDCADRQDGCHGRCDRYKEYKQEHEAAKQWVKQQAEADNLGTERGIRVRRRMRRKLGGANK